MDYFLPSTDKNIRSVFVSEQDNYNSEEALPVTKVADSDIGTYVDRVFIGQGLDDDTVTVKNAKSFYKALQDKPIESELHLYPEVGIRKLLQVLLMCPF